ncbi:MAG: hypothetical protein S0880_11290 [Actinomycetota bacterium]|nr:hypothetical protein [Actinomycetota bacterium]
MVRHRLTSPLVPVDSRRTGRGTRLAAVALTGALALGGCAIPGAALDDGPGLAGTYTVNGVDPVGTEYSGTVTIVGTDDPDTFALEWIVTGTIQEGNAVLDGDVLTVDWETTSSSRGLSTGTAVYELDAEGVLHGERFVDGVAEPGTEEIFPDP